MLQLNGKQWLGIVGAVISVLMVSSAQLTDLMGAGPAKYIVTIAGLFNMLLQSISVALSTQTSLVKDVAAMPGVEPLRINALASPALATAAIDPANKKIAPTPEAKEEVTAIAKAAS